MNSRSKAKANKRALSASPAENAIDSKRPRLESLGTREIESTVTWVADKFFVSGTSTGIDEHSQLLGNTPTENGSGVSTLSNSSCNTLAQLGDTTDEVGVVTQQTNVGNDKGPSRAVFGDLPDVNQSLSVITSNEPGAAVHTGSIKSPVVLNEFHFPGRTSSQTVHVFSAAASSIDIVNHVYPMNAVPRSVGWGKKTAALAKFLCVAESPITVKVVGMVTSVYFYDRTGSPVERVSVGIRPLRECDSIAAQKYLESCSSGKRPTVDNDEFVLYASKYCTKTVRGEVKPQVYRFENIWDGTRCVDSLATRVKGGGPESLTVNDIVMLEVRLFRWKNTSAGPSSGWTSFTAGFQLEAVTLLVEDNDNSQGSDNEGMGSAF
ncbi:hypothetical protein BDW22DRAFT_1430610 [Trametopsis cervina]|nr:hypothetical protein BDW22DRAFT_1430610 [Trametopsis cervina]